MDTTSPSPPRRLLLPLALLVPLVVDPWGLDTLATERLVLGLVGLALLGLEALEVLVARRPVLPLANPELALVALTMWSALSVVWATNEALAVGRLVLLLGILGVARTVRASVSGTASTRGWILALLGVALAALGVDALIIRERLPEMGAGADKYASVLFEHNNMAGNYAALVAPLAACLLVGTGGRRRALGAVGLAACLGYLLLVGSKAGLLACLVVLPLVFAGAALRKVVTRLAAPGVVAGVALAAAVLVVGVLPFSDQARGLAKDAFYATMNVLSSQGISDARDGGFRMDLNAKTIQMAKEAPLRGVGAANWSVEYPRYERHIRDRPHAHNDALQVLAELGAPGLLLFLALFGALLLTQWRVLTTARTPGTYACGLGLMGATLAFLVCGVFEVPFTIGSTASVLALVIGLTTRLGETGGRAAAAVRPGRVPAFAIVLLVMAGLVHTARRLPASALVARAAEREEAGDLDGAVEAMARVANLGTGSWEPERALGRLELDRGNPDVALLHFQAARSLSPHKTDLLRDEGAALMDLARFEEAVTLFEEATERNPGAEWPLSGLTHALDKAGRLPEAIDLLT